jgi:ABC-type multidrug transport system ATPase subunit
MKLAAFSKKYTSGFSLTMPEMELLPGQIYAVIGANGSGKSTLARIAAGILPPDNGGRITTGTSVGYMPQHSYAFRMTLERNLLLNGGAARANELMHALHLDSLAQKNARLLSGGETARMAQARLLMRPYDLIILDEPTASMDMESTLLAESCLCNYCRQSDAAALLVTHSLQQARRIAQEVWFLQNGALLESGSAEQVLYSPQSQETSQFLEFYGVL